MRLSQIPWLAELTDQRTPPCVSIYQPLHRAAPPAHENPIRFRNLLRQAEQSLLRAYPAEEARQFIEGIRAEIDVPEFWTGPRDGMAVFAAPGYLRIIQTQQPISELVVVADSFHIKPLMRIMQSADRYHILCFSQGQVRLFEGSRTGIHRIEMINTPQSIHQLAGDAPTAAPEPSRPPPGSLDHLIRAVDAGIWENHSRPERLPLILFADAQYHPMWSRITRNQYLLDEGVMLSPDHLSNERIRDESWVAYKPVYLQQIDHLADQYHAACAHNLGSGRLEQIAQAAAAGRVGALLLAEKVYIPGRLDPTSGKIHPGRLSDPDVDDVLDDLAEMVLRKNGQVVALPADLMPNQVAMAAIYRF